MEGELNGVRIKLWDNKVAQNKIGWSGKIIWCKIKTQGE